MKAARRRKRSSTAERRRRHVGAFARAYVSDAMLLRAIEAEPNLAKRARLYTRLADTAPTSRLRRAALIARGDTRARDPIYQRRMAAERERDYAARGFEP